MPARTDHDRRDAQHAARTTISVALGRYIRRMTEEAYAYIEEEAAKNDGTEAIDWSEIGTSAATRALASYGVSAATPEPAIDGTADKALESGSDTAE